MSELGTNKRLRVLETVLRSYKLSEAQVEYLMNYIWVTVDQHKD